MLTDLELGWLAGIIDGEGSLQVHFANKGKYETGGNPAAEVRVEASSLVMIDRIAGLLDRLDIKYRMQGPFRRPMSTKDAYRVAVYRSREVVRLLKTITPILVVKAPEAAVILAWYERWPDQRGNKVNRATYDEKIVFYETLRSLKKVA